MKKIVLSVIVALIAITANAQVYVGGTFGVGSDKVETEGTEVKNTTFKILPEVGYELNEDWSVGTVVGYEYNKSGDVKTNTFTIAPYARYFFLNSDVVRLFADGGFGFSTSKTKGNDALNSWNIGPIDIQVVICEYGTSHGGDTDCLIFQTHIGYNLGD